MLARKTISAKDLVLNSNNYKLLVGSKSNLHEMAENLKVIFQNNRFDSNFVKQTIFREKKKLDRIEHVFEYDKRKVKKVSNICLHLIKVLKTILVILILTNYYD